MKPGCIYTRIGDKNTPNDSNAEYYEIELLWKKRFGLIKPPLEFIYDSLQNKLNWKEYECDWYHIYKPEYVIHTYSEDNDFPNNPPRYEFYSYSQVNESTSFMLLDIIANRTVLESYQIVCLDSGRLTIPVPKWGFIKQTPYSHDKISYKYYSKKTKRFTLLEFMYNSKNSEERYAFNHLMNVVLIFESEDERIDFEDYVTYNINNFKKRLSKIERYNHIETDSERQTEAYIKQLNTGYLLNEMLKEYRNEYGNL